MKSLKSKYKIHLPLQLAGSYNCLWVFVFLTALLYSVFSFTFTSSVVLKFPSSLPLHHLSSPSLPKTFFSVNVLFKSFLNSNPIHPHISNYVDDLRNNLIYLTMLAPLINWLSSLFIQNLHMPPTYNNTPYIVENH